jgi:magnesium transporter
LTKQPAPKTPPAEHRASQTQDRTGEEVRDALHGGDIERAVDLTVALHHADAADLIDQLSAAERELLVGALGGHLGGELLSHLEEDTRDEVLDQLAPQAVAEAISDLETDDAVELLSGLDEDIRSSILDAIPATDRVQIRAGLAYPDESAGRLMQRTFIAVPAFWNIGQAIDFLRDSENLPDDFYEIFVIDPTGRPVGTVPLNRFLRSRRDVVMQDVMHTEPRLIPVAMDQEEVAYRFSQYDLASAAVVDDSGRMVGVIMIDDVVDVIHEEAAEDMLRLSGVAEPGLARSVATTIGDRFMWLFVNLLTAILASVVIFLFEGTIEQIVAVAVLMPIVASMGGNAATQTLAIAVRAIATHDLTAANTRRVITKELLVATVNGLVFAVLVAVVGTFWTGSPELGVVFGMAMIVTMISAGLAGIVIPLGLDRMRIDPAIASSVFVTAVTDVVGFLSFLGLVAWLLL